MSWREKMAPATFRGVEFFVDTSELEGGRRTIAHEYPKRDIPFVEDLGRKGRAFPIDGYLIGDEYMGARDSLIGALETDGPGELRHPYYGTRRVAVESFRIRETKQDGGMAIVSIVFLETEQAPRFPSSAPAARALVFSASSIVLAALRLKASITHAINMPLTALASLQSVVSGAATALESAMAPIMTTAQTLSSLKRGVEGILSDVVSLAREPAEFFDELVGTLESLATPPSILGVQALLKAYGFSPSENRPLALTTVQSAEQEIYDTLLQVARIVPVVYAAQLAPDAAYDNYQAAVDTRESVSEALDIESETVNDEIYSAIMSLRAALIRAVPGEDSDLPRLIDYTPPATIPSLVLAYQLYGDVSREADIVTRNSVKRPGFVTGGVALEVLSNV